MTKRYTAADFANAEFAEHPAGGRGHRIGPNEWRLGDSTFRFYTEEMIPDGWVPVPTKPTITESRYQFLVDIGNRHYQAGFNDALTEFGISIVPDPEPTNTDRLEKLIISAPGNFEGVEAILKRPANVRAWAEYLNDHGVTAPKEDG